MVVGRGSSAESLVYTKRVKLTKVKAADFTIQMKSLTSTYVLHVLLVTTDAVSSTYFLFFISFAVTIT